MKTIHLILLVTLVGCASKPVLYPNTKYKAVGKEKAKKDVNMCMSDAEEFLESSKGKQIAKGAAAGGIIGAVVGGVTGLLTGDVKGAMTRSTAIYGVAGATGAAISPDRLRQTYTNKCLGDKGYKVLGWD